MGLTKCTYMIANSLFVIALMGCTLQAKITDMSSGATTTTTPTTPASPSSGTISYSLSSSVLDGSQAISIAPAMSGTISSCSVSPALPSGLSLNATTGVISGTSSTPTVSATYTISCIDGAGATQTSTITFEVAGAYTVNSTADTSDASPGNGVCATASLTCTLRAATEEATAQPTGTLAIITMPAGTFVLATPVSISTRVNIVGVSSASTIIDGNNATKLISQTNGTLSLKNLRIYRGNNSASAGGGIEVNNLMSSACLSLDSVDMIQNTTSFGSNGGGAVYFKAAGGTLTITNSTFSNNSTTGGGANRGGGALHIEYSASINISKSTFSSNSVAVGSGGAIFIRAWAAGGSISESYFVSNSNATGDGGAIYMDRDLNVYKSTFVSNTARRGGALCNFNSATLNVENSTFYANLANVAPRQGAAIYTSSSFPTVVKSSTFIANDAGAGSGGVVYVSLSADINFSNSILSANLPTNCFINLGTITSGGYNIDSAATCGLGGTGDASTTNPLVVAGAPVNNGGVVPTIALQVTSPAIDAGDPAAPTTDARGTARPRGAAMDKGAYEY